MDNLLEFEESSVFISSTICLGIFDVLLFLSHVFLIIQILNEKSRLELLFQELSCIHIFAQLIFSCLFFCLLHRFNLSNSTFLILSNLIGIILTLEWLCLYFYFYHNDNLIFAIFHMLLPICFVVIILSLLLITWEFNKTVEIILINITFIFYVLMFISPGVNTIKLFKAGNPKFISLINSIIGNFVNFFMIFFLFTLSHYKLISLLFIIYPIISLIICCLQVIYYFLKIGAYRNSGELIEKIDNEDTDKKGKPISLISSDSIEE